MADTYLNIISLLQTVFSILVMRKCLNVFFKPISKSMYKYTVWIAYFLYQAGIGISEPFAPTMVLVLNMLFVFLISCVSYEGSFKRHCLFSVLICSIWMLVEVIVSMSFALLEFKGDSETVGAAVSEIIMFIFAVVTRNLFRKRSVWDIPNKYTFILLLIPFSSIYIIHNIFLMASYVEGHLIFPFVSGILLLMVNYVIFEVYDWLAKDAEIKKKNLLYEQQLELCSQQTSEREAQNREVRRIRHDIKNHFVTLLGLVQAGSKEEVILYIEDILETFTVCTVQGVSHSGNNVVDALVNYKYSLAQIEGIAFNANVFVPTSLPFQSGHLAIILGNLLDNALDACRKSEKGKQSINLAISYEKEMLSIVVCNTYGGELKQDQRGRFMTAKKDQNSHGLGLASIEQTVASNQGEFLTECGDGIFKAMVIMYGCRGGK